MINILGIITCLFLSSPETNYSVKVEYYSKPLVKMEWSIHVWHENNKPNIEIINYRSKSFKKNIDFERYLKLISKMNFLGVWGMTDKYSLNSGNPFYKFEIRSKNRSNFFKVEANVPFTGKNYQLTEILRLLRNNADLVINDSLNRNP